MISFTVTRSPQNNYVFFQESNSDPAIQVRLFNVGPTVLTGGKFDLSQTSHPINDGKTVYNSGDKSIQLGDVSDEAGEAAFQTLEDATQMFSVAGIAFSAISSAIK